MEYVVKTATKAEAIVSAPNSGCSDSLITFVDAPMYGNGILLESPANQYTFIRTEAKNFDELKADCKACKKLIEKIVKYSGASDSVPSLWHFDTFEEADTFAAIFGCYQNPEWGRDIEVAKVNNGYVVGEPELF